MPAERTKISAKPRTDPEAPHLLERTWSQGIAGLRLQAMDERLAGRSRIASAVLVLVLLGISVFAVWSSQVTSNAASRAAAAINMSDRYGQAASDVAAEE